MLGSINNDQLVAEPDVWLPERADPSASEAASEPGSDALKSVPPLRR